MGLDQYIEICKHTDEIMPYVINGVLTSDEIEKKEIDIEWLDKILCSNDVCYWRKQYWVQDYLGKLLGVEIENCERYLLNKYNVQSLLKAYDVFIEKLAPLYNPETGECVGVTKEIVESLEFYLGIEIRTLDWILDSDFGYKGNTFSWFVQQIRNKKVLFKSFYELCR